MEIEKIEKIEEMDLKTYRKYTAFNFDKIEVLYDINIKKINIETIDTVFLKNYCYPIAAILENKNNDWNWTHDEIDIMYDTFVSVCFYNEDKDMYIVDVLKFILENEFLLYKKNEEETIKKYKDFVKDFEDLDIDITYREYTFIEGNRYHIKNDIKNYYSTIEYLNKINFYIENINNYLDSYHMRNFIFK